MSNCHLLTNNRLDEIHELLGELSELMDRDDNSAFEADCYRSSYAELEREYAALTAG